ncbi:MAG: putative sporulation protein YtxC [Clostridiaceae bacterium]
MLITTLSYKEEKEELNRDLLNMINYYKNKGINLGISEKVSKNIHFINLYTDEDIYVNNYRKSLYYYVSKIIYGALLSEFKKEELKNYIEDNFFYLTQEEKKEIEENCILSLKAEEICEKNIYSLNVKNQVTDKILACLNENYQFNLDGFIQFRKKDIYNDFKKILENVIEEFFIEKEYNEFIKLLKYFIDMEDPKLARVDIIIRKDGSFKVVDEKGKDMETILFKNINDLCMVENSSMEDMIMSGLITSAPKEIVIHCRENSINDEILETILKVFGERVKFCDSCRLCSRIKRRG